MKCSILAQPASRRARDRVARCAPLAAGALLAAGVLLGGAGSAQAQAPGAPTLTATPGRFHVDLSWTTPTGTITSYQYRDRRGSSTTFERWKDVPSSGPTTTSYQVASLLNGVAHGFQVRAMNGSTPGAASNAANATPRTPAPTGVTLTTASDLGFSNSDRLTSDRTPTVTISGLLAPQDTARNNSVRVTIRSGSTTSLQGAPSTRAATVDAELGINASGTYTITAEQAPDGNLWSLHSPALTITMDVDKPALTAAAYNISTKKLALTFDESVDASTLAPAEMHLRLRETSTFGQNLAGATATTTDGASQTLTLTDAQAETILQYTSLQLDADADGTRVCTTPGAGEEASAACDLAGNILESAGAANEDIAVSVATPGAPDKPDLLSVSDSGEDNTDNLTAGTTSQGTLRGGYVILNVTGFTDNALVTITATQGTATLTHSVASRSPLEHDLSGLTDGQWTITATQTTAGAKSAASPALVVTMDDTHPTLSDASYNPTTNTLRLTYSETMNVSTLELSKFTIRDTDGVPGTVTLTGATAPTTDGATVAITLTSSQATSVESMGDPQLRIGNQAIDDLAGNNALPVLTNRDLPAGLPVTLSVSPNPVTEGSSATVTASLTGTTTAATTVTVAAARGTAEAGDFTLSTNKTLTIAAGQTSSTGTVTIAAVQDTDTANETVTVSATASNSSNAVTNPADVTLTITDDDATPAAPTNLSATPGEGEVALAWTAPAGTITGYDYSQDDGGTWSAMTGSGASTVAWTVTGLSNGTEYSFRVRARNSAGAGASSNTVRATPKAATSVPGAPTLSATAGNTRVNLTWTAPSGQPITGWDYSQDNGSTWTAISNSGPATRRHTVTGLTNGTQYTFKVRAKNSQGNGAESNAVNARPSGGGAAVPGAPTGLRATAGNAQVSLTWTAPSGSITGWDYSQDNGVNWTAITGSGATTTSHTVRNLTNGRQYTFRVRAKNAAGNGAQSNQARATPQAVPGAPTGLTAAPGNTVVQLTWTAPSGSITGWDYSQDNGATWQEVPGASAATTSYTVPRLVNNREYTFRVRAKNAAGVGAASDPVPSTPIEATAPPDLPTNLTATAGDTQVTLAWVLTGGQAPERWDYTLDGRQSWVRIPDSGPGTRRHTVTGLTNGTEYTFQVQAWNRRGFSLPSNEAQATPTAGTEAPRQPLSLIATPGDGKVTLSWTLPTGGPSITCWEYTIDDGRTWLPIPGCGPQTTTFMVTDLTNGTEYTFRVRAVNSVGPGTPSDAVRATPGEGVPALPLGALALLLVTLLAGGARAVRRRQAASRL